MITRRTLVTGAAAAAAAVCSGAAGAAPGAGPDPEAGRTPEAGAAPAAAEPSPAPDAAGEIGVQTLAEAEKLAAVQYTDAERAQILESIADQLAHVRALRGFALEREMAPAQHFDPRPSPDFRIPARTAVRGSRARPPLPARDEDLAFAPLTSLAVWLRSGALSSARLTELSLRRLQEHGPRLHCVVELTADLAREQAARADAELRAGKPRSPLHGVPYGAKDLLDTRGIRTTYGAEPFARRVPERDAVCVRRLADAGAVLVAKLSLGALAYGDLWFGGVTRNPWNPDEGSSGSSAGSAAAVAAGLVPFAIGSETYGSILSPSARCGPTGLRPTFGRVARSGAMPLCWSLDKLGALARSAEDALHVLHAIDGADPGDPSSVDAGLRFDAAADVRGRSIGCHPSWFEGGELDVERAALEAARRAGLKLVEVDWPPLPYEGLLPILFAEAAAAFEDLTLGGGDDELAWQDTSAWPNTFRTSRFLSAVDLVQADRLRRQVVLALHGVFSQLDALLAPIDHPLLLATNFSGHPALALRAGFELQAARPGPGLAASDPPGPAREVPCAVALYGRLYEDGALCEIGAALERSLGVAARRPPGFA